jgi:hypothetical protein
MDNRGKEWKNA